MYPRWCLEISVSKLDRKGSAKSWLQRTAFKKFKYNFHHWQWESLQNLSSWWIPRTAANSKHPAYCFTHKACKWCPEYAWMVCKRAWRLMLYGWVAKRSWAISCYYYFDDSFKNDTLRARLYLADYNWGNNR